jgi:hypothetical protein
MPGGHLSDRRSAVHALVVGSAAFLFACGSFAGSGAGIGVLLAAFVLAGVGIGFGETGPPGTPTLPSADRVRSSAT